MRQQKRMISQLIKETYPEINFQINIGHDYDGRRIIKVGVYNEDDVNILVDLLNTETDCYFVVRLVSGMGELY